MAHSTCLFNRIPRAHNLTHSTDILNCFTCLIGEKSHLDWGFRTASSVSPRLLLIVQCLVEVGASILRLHLRLRRHKARIMLILLLLLLMHWLLVELAPTAKLVLILLLSRWKMMLLLEKRHQLRLILKLCQSAFLLLLESGVSRWVHPVNVDSCDKLLVEYLIWLM